MFGSIDVRTRPIRIAYLVDPNNAEQVRGAIRLSATLWGGVYFPIIQLHKRMPATWREKPLKAPAAERVIQGYIDAFDPDVLVQFASDLPPYIANRRLQIVRPEEIWQPLAADKSVSPKYGIGIFEILKDLFDKHFKYKAKYPMKVVFPTIPSGKLSLFWAGLFGEVSSELKKVIDEHYAEPLEIETVPFEVTKFREMTERDTLFPTRIVRHGLEQSHRSGYRRDANVFFMDATKTEDIVDYWNLRALGRQVLPMPIQLTADDEFKQIIIGFLKRHRRPWPHNPAVCDVGSFIRARNCSFEEMQAYANTLTIERTLGDPSTDPFYSLQHWYPRVWDEWARDKDSADPNDTYGEERSSVDLTETKDLNYRFRPLLPTFANRYSYHGEPRCVNEVSFRFYGSNDYLAEVLPKSSGDNVERVIAGHSFRGDWRVGRNGLVKLVKDQIPETRDILTAQDVMFAWFTDLAWSSKLSPPGILATQIYKRLDGHPSILRNEKLLGLLEHMNGGLVRQDGTPLDDNKIGPERELPVGEVRSRLVAAESHGKLHEYLVSRGVFELGARIQCPNCFRRFWSSAEDIDRELTCPKCRAAFPAIGNLEQSTWCYKTTGPLSIPNYADGAYAVLLALEFFSDYHMHSLRTTRLVSFAAEAPNKTPLEADYAMLWQESRLGQPMEGALFGESKTYGQFGKKDFDRMEHLGDTFPGAILVFSTLRKSLTDDEIRGIRKVAKRGRVHWKAERPINPVLVLTGTELLSWMPPPMCWDDTTKARFSRMFGLLDLCDATQQLYLGFPPWEMEWSEKWEKRRQQQAARNSSPPTAMADGTRPVKDSIEPLDN